MNFYWVSFLIIVLMEIAYSTSKPFTDEDGDNFRGDESESDLEERRRRKNKRKPCQRVAGEEQKGEGDERTFFQFSYVDVNYNYNCGNGMNQKRPHHHQNHQNNHQNHQNNHQNHHQNNNNKPENIENDDVVHENDDNTFSTTRRPHRPLGNFLMNHNGALIQTFFGNLFGTNKPKVDESNPIPVHEAIQNDETTKYEPGLYVSAYNPINGQYLQGNLTNPKRIYRRINKGVDFLLSPLYDLI
ncbi:GATA zinc finger domain-containing protein 12-like [Onthophagus taurus]|uniref:GATA zinc finger domain-containing protein 12-like n=1 Tax=Onthophagus taurus TaxID=166361 RepID=UPI0039BDC7AD